VGKQSETHGTRNVGEAKRLHDCTTARLKLSILNYINIHSHTYIDEPGTVQLLNVFPHEKEKLLLPCYFSVGLHPWHIKDETRDHEIEIVRSASSLPSVMAIGETGLDKTISVPLPVQQEVFEEHLHIAEDFHKAVVIHCVRSYSEILHHRKKSDQSIPWIFHWFNSNEQTAGELIRKNCYLSFGHMLFIEQSKAFQVFKNIPLEYTFLETDDAGYSIQQVYEQAAMIRNMHPDELKSGILDNFARCFKNQ
jgi:TatD DNase family protein